MALVHFLTHPDVLIDPAVPVPDWPLSAEGRRRMALALERPFLRAAAALFSSTERKAVEAAAMVADRFGLEAVALGALGENDRSATGYLEKEDFERTADLFFARPETGVRGWERAVDAQARIVRAVEEVLRRARAGDVAIVAHGGVGALLRCHLGGVAISRSQDQPGQGHVFSFDRETRGSLSRWRRIEDG